MAEGRGSVEVARQERCGVACAKVEKRRERVGRRMDEGWTQGRNRRWLTGLSEWMGRDLCRQETSWR